MKVMIVGGGLMGLSIARELRSASIEVEVLERAVPGAEASSAAAGMLAPQLEDVSGPMLGLATFSRSAWPSFARQLEAETETSVGYTECGSLQVAFDQTEALALRSKVARHQAAGLRAQLLEGPALHAVAPALNGSAITGASFPDDHQVDPRKLLKALSVSVTRAGASFRSGTVRSLLEKQGRIVGVDHDGERRLADVVVLAAGAWSSLVPGSGITASSVRPVRGQMVALELRAPIVTQVLKGAGGYVVPRRDGRVIAGSTTEHVGFEKSVTAGGLATILASALQLVPGLAEASVVESWAGLRPWTEQSTPFLGPSGKPGLVLATGHYRNGILLAPATATLVGQVVKGEQPSIDLSPFSYPGAADQPL